MTSRHAPVVPAEEERQRREETDIAVIHVGGDIHTVDILRAVRAGLADPVVYLLDPLIPVDAEPEIARFPEEGEREVPGQPRARANLDGVARAVLVARCDPA